MRGGAQVGVVGDRQARHLVVARAPPRRAWRDPALGDDGDPPPVRPARPGGRPPARCRRGTPRVDGPQREPDVDVVVLDDELGVGGEGGQRPPRASERDSVRAHLGERPVGGRAEQRLRGRRARCCRPPRWPSWPRGTRRSWRRGRGPGCGSARGRRARRSAPSGSTSSTRLHAVDERRGQRLHALDGDALGDLRRACRRHRAAASASAAARARTSSVSSSSRHGGAHRPCSATSRLRWSATLNQRTSSTVSPQNSTRTGCSSVGGKTSRMPPRTANSPRRSTRSVRV